MSNFFRGYGKKVITPVVIIALWIGLAVVGVPYLLKISGASSNDLSTFLPESSESTKVMDELGEFTDADATSAIIVFGSDKPINDNRQLELQKISSNLEDTKLIRGNVSPVAISDDKMAAFIVAPIASNADFDTAISKLQKSIADTGTDLEYKFTGPAMFARDLNSAFSVIDGPLLFVAIAVVFVILLVVYRSPILPIVTLLSSLFALAVAVTIVWFLVKADLVLLNGQVQGILFILVIGVTTDYALLYISRYREELARHEDKWQATKQTLKNSWEPIVAAGGTVTIGLLCLLASDLGSNKALGPVGGIGVIVGIISALTFLPSILLLLGRKAFWPKQPKVDTKALKTNYLSEHPVWSRIGNFVKKHPRRLWIGFSVVLISLCFFASQLNFHGVPQTELVIGPSETRDGQNLLEKHFPSGSGSPVLVIASVKDQQAITQILDEDTGVHSVSIASDNKDMPSIPVGKYLDSTLETMRNQVETEHSKKIEEISQQISQQMAGAPTEMVSQAIQQAERSIPSIDELVEQSNPFSQVLPRVANDKVLLQATLNNPVSSSKAKETVKKLRENIQADYPDTKLGGTTAIQLDTGIASERDLMVVAPLILVAITIILIILLRSIVAPLILLLTTVVSFGTTLGVSALMFNHVFGYPGSESAVLIFAFVFLVALGIDYNIFLMTRAREESKKLGVRDGTIKALVVTGGVISSAGIVLASTFATLYIVPILFLAQMAFIVSFGVLLDTIIVRSLIVPSLTIEIGDPMWWPSKLSKKKNVDKKPQRRKA